jgi:mRNA interferase RelE/StbE
MTTPYQLKIYQKVEKQLQRIPKNHLERVVTAMRSLSQNPRPSGYVKLDDNLYRIRQGQYRIIYAVFDAEVVIVICKVARRAEDTYKNLQSLLARAEKVLANED